MRLFSLPFGRCGRKLPHHCEKWCMRVSSSIKMTDVLHNALECFQLHKKINQPGLFKIKWTFTQIVLFLPCLVILAYLYSPLKVCMCVYVGGPVLYSVFIVYYRYLVWRRKSWVGIPQFSFRFSHWLLKQFVCLSGLLGLYVCLGLWWVIKDV